MHYIQHNIEVLQNILIDSRKEIYTYIKVYNICIHLTIIYYCRYNDVQGRPQIFYVSAVCGNLKKMKTRWPTPAYVIIIYRYIVITTILVLQLQVIKQNIKRLYRKVGARLQFSKDSLFVRRFILVDSQKCYFSLFSCLLILTFYSYDGLIYIYNCIFTIKMNDFTLNY